MRHHFRASSAGIAVLLAACADLPGAYYHVQLSEPPSDAACSDLAGAISRELDFTTGDKGFFAVPRSQARECYLTLEHASAPPKMDIQILQSTGSDDCCFSA